MGRDGFARGRVAHKGNCLIGTSIKKARFNVLVKPLSQKIRKTQMVQASGRTVPKVSDFRGKPERNRFATMPSDLRRLSSAGALATPGLLHFAINSDFLSRGRTKCVKKEKKCGLASEPD